MAEGTLFSIHDLWPESLEPVAELLELILASHPEAPVSLLVVPHRGWAEPDLVRLRQCLDRGGVLAGHGWEHRSKPPSTLYHRIHSALLSRDVAEHLSRSREELRTIIQDCYDWFDQQKLPAPDTYVPPAWAMGALRREDLQGLPFRYYEYLHGIYDSEQDRFSWLPLKGYEADTGFRAFCLRATNGVNQNLPGPLRIAIHPNDHLLRMGRELKQDIQDASGPYLLPSELFSD